MSLLVDLMNFYVSSYNIKVLPREYGFFNLSNSEKIEQYEIASHPGLAKLIIGWIIKELKSSRAMHRTRGHWASVDGKTVAKSPPMSC